MARIETVRAVSGNDETVAGSFRDPAGFVFRRDGAILRHVARSYGPIYDRLVASGLYQSDPAPNSPSLISRIFSGYGPNWGGLPTRWV